MSSKQTSAVSIESDHDYAAFEEYTAERVTRALGPLFETDAAGLWEAYLAGIPAESRQHYTCHACRRFIQRFGGLVKISDDGKISPLIFEANTVPEFFDESVAAMDRIIRGAKVTGVFLSSDKVWGTPKTGEWTHLAGISPEVFGSPLKTAFQAAAEKREDYATLCRGLAEIPMEAVVQAVRVLEADAVDRSEKTLGVAQWLLALHKTIDGIKGPRRSNIIWRAVATAPPGWCHIRSTMIATLLDDVVAGLPFEEINRRWNAKMHPLQYQRPTAVKEGTLRQANEVVAKLGSEGALQRRFAKLSDILSPLWTPIPIAPFEKPKGGAFDHLMESKRGVKEVELPAKTISWEKFQPLLLSAHEMTLRIPSGTGSFYGLVTAANPEAPPILQWDGLEGLPRNPASWYFYHGGSPAHHWSLTAGAWVPVLAVCLKPCYWQQPDKFTHQGTGVFFVLQGAKDVRHVTGGGFFPESLKSEYHGIRSAMEAHAQGAAIAGREEGDANGICLSESVPLLVRIKTPETSCLECRLTYP
jgi:hypothetical protein